MADAWIKFNKPVVPGEVTGGGEIGQDEFLSEFKVKVVYPGCYAIVPTLKSYTRGPWPDYKVAYVRGAELDCYCFKGQEEKTFYVTGLGEPPMISKRGEPDEYKKALTPEDPNATRLEPLQGKWPKSDFPFDNLELYVSVEVKLCNKEECSDKICKRKFRTNDRDKQKTVGEAESPREDDTNINGGPSVKEKAIEGAKEGSKMMTGAIPLPKPK